MERTQVSLLARTAKEARRYGDAVQMMRQITRLGVDLRVDERLGFVFLFFVLVLFYFVFVFCFFLLLFYFYFVI